MKRGSNTGIRPNAAGEKEGSKKGRKGKKIFFPLRGGE